MNTPRRDFLRTTTAAIGAATITPWILETGAAQNAAIDATKSELADLALSTARRLGASYADIRINRYRSESVFTREQQVQSVSRNQDFGFGVRVLVRGTWGFAASPLVTPDAVRRVAQAAVDIARANAVFQKKRINLVDVPKTVTSWRSSFEKDPFDVSLEDKIQFLLKLNGTALPRAEWCSRESGLPGQDGEPSLLGGRSAAATKTASKAHHRNLLHWSRFRP